MVGWGGNWLALVRCMGQPRINSIPLLYVTGSESFAVNWLASVCAVPRMLWKWNWLLDGLHDDAIVRAGFTGSKGDCPLLHTHLPLWELHRLFPYLCGCQMSFT